MIQKLDFHSKLQTFDSHVFNVTIASAFVITFYIPRTSMGRPWTSWRIWRDWTPITCSLVGRYRCYIGHAVPSLRGGYLPVSGPLDFCLVIQAMHDLKYMHTQTAPLFNIPCRRHGTTIRVVHPYPCWHRHGKWACFINVCTSNNMSVT